jgi:PAS domain S-box-containing protein/diguanylate cyclase (GGDEF)-like protein
MEKNASAISGKVEILSRAESSPPVLIECTGDHIWSVDLSYRLTSFNRAFQHHLEKVYGVSAAVGMRMEDLIPTERYIHWLSNFGQVLSEGPIRFEYPMLDGRTLSVTLTPIIANGTTAGIYAVGEDITDRKVAENALKEAEARYRAIFNGALEGMFQTSVEGKILTANLALARILGFDSPDEIVSSISDVAHELWADPNDRTAFLRQIEEHGVVQGFEYRFKRKDGRIIWALLSARKVCADDGRVLYLEGFIEDITDRKLAEQALAKSEARFRNLFEQNGSVMVIVEPESGAIVSANRAASRFYGYALEQLIGMNVSQINTLPPEEVIPDRKRALNDERNFFKFRHRLASGEERDVEVYSTPVTMTGRPHLFSIVHDVTEQKRAEDALRENEESLRESQRIAGLGSYALDFQTGVWSSSEVMDAIFGIDPAYEHTVEGWAALIHPDNRAMMTAYFAEEVAGKGQSFDKEYRIVRQTDRAERWVHGLGRLEFDAQGKPLKMHGTIKDITERKQAELRLRESEERYRATFEQAAVGILHVSFEGSILRCNARFAEILEYTNEELRGQTIHRFTAPDDLANSKGVMERLQTGKVATESLEKRYIRKNGASTWVKMTISLQRDGEGRALHFIGLAEDINARKAAEERLAAASEALRESEERYRATFEQAAVGIVHSSFEGRILRCNARFAEILGYTAEEICGLTIRQVTAPEDLAASVKSMERLTNGTAVTDSLEKRYCRKNGSLTWVKITVSLQRDAQGRPVHSIAMVEDINDRKAAEERLAAASEALRESEERYRATFEQAAVGIVHTTFDGRILLCNKHFAEILGYGAEEVPGMTIWQFTLPEDHAESRMTFERTGSGAVDPVMKEKRYIRKDGNLIWVKLTVSAQRDAEGRPVHCIAVVEDINDRKIAEERLAKTQEALRSSEERHRIAFQTSANAVSIVRLDDGRYLDVNEAFLSALGYERDEVIGRTARELNIFASPDDLLMVAESLRGSSIIRDEFQFRTKSGTFIWGLISASPFEHEGNACALFVTQDITKAKAAAERLAAAQEALRVSEDRYRTVFHTSPDAVLVTRRSDGVILDANQSFLDSSGFERDEVIGSTSKKLGIWVNESDRRLLLDQLKKQGICRDLEVLSRRKNGEIFWMRITASLIEIRGEQCLIAFAKEITEVKAAQARIASAQEALRVSEERYRTIFQTSVDGICISSLSDGRYLEANKAFIDLLGFDREEVIGQTSTGLNLWADPGLRDVLVDKLRRNTSFRDVETQFVRKNGTPIWLQISGSVIEIDGAPCVLSIVRDISAAKAAEESLAASREALRVSEKRYRIAFETSLDAINISRIEDGMFIDCNKAFFDLTGYTREEVIGRTGIELNLWVADRDRQKLFEELQRESNCRDLQAQFRKKNGEVGLGLMSASVMDIDGVPCMLCMTRDISEAKAAEDRLAASQEALRVSEERYRIAFQTSLDGITINRLSDGMYIECNKAFLDTTGYEREEVIGKTSLELGIWTDYRNRRRLVEILRQNGNCRDLEVQFRKRSGEVFWVMISASLIELGDDTCLLSMIRDISGAKAAEDKIRNLAYYDSLTGLPNRRLLLERLRETLALSVSLGCRQALLLVNMDNFKMLNETLGHQTGDFLLQEASRRIVLCIGDAGTVAKLEGDEFVVTIDDLSATVEEAAVQAKVIAGNILAAVSRPYLLAGREFRSTASIGIAVFGENAETAEETLQKADIALDRAKSAGRNTMHLFIPEMQAAVNARAALEEDLHQTIKTNEFVLYYQPQVNRGKLIGAEALIRWNHPRRGLLTPDKFIPLAEETGLILPLGDWVLETACKQIAAWAIQPSTAHVVVAVNISARQFRQQDFVQRVLSALDRTGANPRNLDLELTESMLVEDIEDVIAKMLELKVHGLRFSLDDFGTGYSSLAYLRRLPLDVLKIDRSFVRDILVDASCGAIAQTILSLSKAMGLPVIAEGVETEEQREFLIRMDCHSFQGYLFSRPLPLEEFERLWLNRNGHALLKPQ